MQTEPQKPRRALGIAFLIVFLDMMGFSVLFPLFPSMLEHYLGDAGTESLIGRLVAFLSDLARDESGQVDPIALHAFFGGVLGSIYSVLQFLFAPYWGARSDALGRRPVLLLTLAGTALSYVIWFFAGTFEILILARLLGGIMAGNVSTATALVADVTTQEDRAKGMGMIGAGIGLGFVLGPAFGGLTAGWDLTQTLPDFVAYGVNPFSGCALVALAIALLNLMLVVRRLPETLPVELRGKESMERTRSPFRALGQLDSPALRRTNVSYFLYLLAFAAMEFTLTFLAADRLDYGPRDNAKMFVFVGLLIALVQGGLVRRLAPKFGEAPLALAGMLMTVPGFLLVGTMHGEGQLYGGLALLAVGSAFVMPSLSALVSRLSSASSQGLALGIFRSLGSAARAAGPILGGALFFGVGAEAPYLIGAALLLAPVELVRRIRGAATPEL